MKLIKLLKTVLNIYLPDFLAIYFFPSEKKALEVLCALVALMPFLKLPLRPSCSSPSFSMLGWHFCISYSYNYILALTFSSYPWLSLHLTSIDIILISLMLIILYLTHWEIFVPCIQKPTSCFLCCGFFFFTRTKYCHLLPWVFWLNLFLLKTLCSKFISSTVLKDTVV